MLLPVSVFMDPYIQSATDTTKVDAGNNSKPVPVKRKKRRKKAPKNTTKAPAKPSKTLDATTLVDAGVAEAANKDAVLNDVGKRKKKRRKKKAKNKVPEAWTQVDTGQGEARETIGKTDLEPRADEIGQEVNKPSDKRFQGPSNADNPGNFSEFDHTEVKAIDESILNDDGRRGQAETEPKIHNVEAVHTNTIDKTLVKWEHLALIIEEHFLTTNTV